MWWGSGGKAGPTHRLSLSAELPERPVKGARSVPSQLLVLHLSFSSPLGPLLLAFLIPDLLLTLAWGQAACGSHTLGSSQRLLSPAGGAGLGSIFLAWSAAWPHGPTSPDPARAHGTSLLLSGLPEPSCSGLCPWAGPGSDGLCSGSQAPFPSGKPSMRQGRGVPED